MAEALLKDRGGDRFRAFSAGSRPKGEVHALALQTLERMRLPTEGLRSKSWNEFSGPGAPQLDFVLTVCGHAAKQECPFWPGHPMTAHWGVDDPAAIEGSRQEQVDAFDRVFRELDARIKLFIELPFASLDRTALQERLRAIGRVPAREQ